MISARIRLNKPKAGIVRAAIGQRRNLGALQAPLPSSVRAVSMEGTQRVAQLVIQTVLAAQAEVMATVQMAEASLETLCQRCGSQAVWRRFRGQ